MGLFKQLPWLFLLVAAGVANAEIYRWVDENGKMQFGDRAPKQRDAEKMAIEAKAPARRQSAPDTRQRLETQQRLLEQMEKERDQRQRKAAKTKRENQKREKYCAQARHDVGYYESSSLLYREKANGEREYLNDAERAEQIRQSHAAVKRWCK